MQISGLPISHGPTEEYGRLLFFACLARTTAHTIRFRCTFYTFLTVDVHDRCARVWRDGVIGGAHEDRRA